MADVTLDDVLLHVAEHGYNNMCATCRQCEYVADDGVHICMLTKQVIKVHAAACARYKEA